MAEKIYINKRIPHDFDIIDTLEVGIVLKGWEVKSIKARHINMGGAYVDYDPEIGLILKGAKVPSWRTAPRQGIEEEMRDRVLLAKNSQIQKLSGLAKRPGYTLVPREVYVSEKGLIKLIIVLVKGKKKFQKKQILKEKDLKRQVERDLKDLF